MGEAIVDTVLETLSSFIQTKLCLYLDVDYEMRRAESLLTIIKGVLEDAEEKNIKDKVIKDWLRKLRDEVHLLDDVLNECSTHVLSLEYQREAQRFCFCFFKLSDTMFRCKMAKKLKDISQRLYEIAEERSKFYLRERVHEERSGVMEWRETTSIITQPLYGRDGEKKNIVDFLVGDASDLEDLTVYPIVGFGGLGKTTLAQQVFYDERVADHFYLRLWVCVSDDFDLSRIVKAIIESAGRPCGYSDLDSLQRQVQELLGRKRYLLVLDDVWNENYEKWYRLKSVLACGSKGASILLTTRVANVVRVTGALNHLQLSPLPEDDCWEIFKQQAFGPSNEERAELVAIGREIAKKCDGVPLAVKTLGSLLRSHSDEKYWISVKENEIWNLPQEEPGESIMSILGLSYLNLPAKLRQCFAYLAVFPKDHWMSKKQVIELWMANGFISTIEGRDAEDVGDEVWNKLNSNSFFEDVRSDGGRSWGEFDNDIRFKMHDLFHDLAQFSAKEECCSNTSESSPPGERTRHLSIFGGRQFNEQWSSYFNRVTSLKSLIILQNYGAITSDVFLKCSSFRAVDLKWLEKVPSSINQLKHLRYLNLSHGRFTMLPDSICRLWNLQILNLQNCLELQTLPNQFKCLKYLRHLHLKNCWSLSTLAPEMSRLTYLKTLHTYIVGVMKGFLLEEIENLKLEGTLHIKHLERVTSVMDAEKANLAKKCLTELELSWKRSGQTQSQESEEKILEALQPHTQLKTLHMVGYFGTQLPRWMVNPILKDLSCLELEDCRNVVRISFVAKLPFLKRLGLSNMDEVQYIDDDCYVDGVERGFQALEFLKLRRLPSIMKLSREDGDNMFPSLSTLKITHCPRLNLPFLPSVTNLNVTGDLSKVLLGSIQNLPNLESLLISYDGGLTSFPADMLGGLKNLKTLHIKSLPKLEALPIGLSNLNALQELLIMQCDSIETITEEVLQGVCSLKRLNILGLPKFKLCAGFRHLVALQHLTIHGCAEVEDLDDALQHVMTLKSLTLDDLPNLASLPQWLGNLSLLETLRICECPKLMSLPQSLTNLKSLQIFGCPELRKTEEMQG